jgi:hypothetical protein
MQYDTGNDFATGYALGRDSTNNGYNNGMFGNDGWWIILLLLCGWGNNNGGFGGGFGNGGYEIGRLATTNDVASGFSTSAIMSDLNDILLGQASIQQTLCQGFNGIQQTAMQGFHGVDNAICTLGYNLSHQLSDCCCKTNSNIDNLRFDISKGLCDVVRAGQDNTQRIIDMYTGDKIDTLNRKLATAEARNNTLENNAYLISQLKEPCPVPAYRVPSPNCCYDFGYFDTQRRACSIVQ